MGDIRLAVPLDRDWVSKIWETKTFSQFSPIWWRYWNPRKKNEAWWVIEGCAFMHVLYTKSKGGVTLYEIAVAEHERRKGYGKSLIQHLPRPIRLKTDEDNIVSRAFYVALGFQQVFTLRGRNTGKKLVGYELY